MQLRTENRKLVERPAFELSRPHMVKVGLPGTSFEKPKERTTRPSLLVLLRDSLCTHFMDRAARQASVYNWKEVGLRKQASDTIEKRRAITGRAGRRRGWRGRPLPEGVLVGRSSRPARVEERAHLGPVILLHGPLLSLPPLKRQLWVTLQRKEGKGVAISLPLVPVHLTLPSSLHHLLAERHLNLSFLVYKVGIM